MPLAARPWAAVSRAFSPASAGSSATMRPPWSTAARSHTRAISRSSLVNIRIAAPSSASGADEVVDLVFGADVDAAGRVEQQHHAQPAGEPAGDRHLLLVAAREPAHLARRPGVDRQPADRLVDAGALLGRAIGPHLATRLNSGMAMFSRMERCGSRACRRSAGTSTTPRRITSKGCRARTGRPSTTRSPRSGLRLPARISNRASWPWPSRAARPSTSPGGRRG